VVFPTTANDEQLAPWHCSMKKLLILTSSGAVAHERSISVDETTVATRLDGVGGGVISAAWKAAICITHWPLDVRPVAAIFAAK